MSQILQVIKERSSTRAYTNEKLTKEEIQQLQEAALASPTANNLQEWHFIFVEGETINELEKTQVEIMLSLNDQEIEERLKSRNYKTYYDAPLMVVITTEKGSKWGKLDAGIAVQNLALAAEGLGLGSVIIGSILQVFDSNKGDYYRKKLQFPQNHEFAIAIVIGHKATTKIPHEAEQGKITVIS